jgi:hypothetical protein
MNKVTQLHAHADRELIERLGGTSKLAKLLGYPQAGGPQRVNHWKTRGIPAEVKLAHPEIFLTNLLTNRKRKVKPKPVEA